MNRLLACMLLASLTGCSFVYIEKDIVGAKGQFATFEPRLIGDWDHKDDGTKIDYGDPKVVDNFARIERKSLDSNTLLAKSINLIKAEGGGAPAELEDPEGPPTEVHVVKLGEVELITVGERLGEITTSEVLHIGKVVWAKDQFGIRLMDSEFFEKNPKLIAHRKQKGDIIITADVEELHAFLKAYGKRDDLWQEPERGLEFQRRKPSVTK